jgi:1,2-diacylglycerol 3-alpha-glucosyltransferase
MALPRVATFTDTYLPTVNGVTYTIDTWRDRWQSRGGEMPVVYPASNHDPDAGEFPVRSVNFPFYSGFRIGLPQLPRGVRDADVVHAHTPFSLGLSGLRLARNADVPLVASYHTPTAEYADYLTSGPLATGVEAAARWWERRFFHRSDVVLVPSDPARDHLRAIGVRARVEVVPNGVDTDVFRPVEGHATLETGADEPPDVADFRERYDLPDGPLVGYTGRHGYEKDLAVLVRAAEGLTDGRGESITVVLGGDGPARADLETLAADLDADVRFLGFMDRADLPAFYASLAVFAFPSPVETQGLVALEANACGTPVAGVDAGALADTVRDGETGYTAPAGDVGAFRTTIERTLDERETLRAACLDRRAAISVEHAVDRLVDVYADVA